MGRWGAYPRRSRPARAGTNRGLKFPSSRATSSIVIVSSQAALFGFSTNSLASCAISAGVAVFAGAQSCSRLRSSLRTTVRYPGGLALPVAFGSLRFYRALATLSLLPIHCSQNTTCWSRSRSGARRLALRIGW